MSQLKSLCYNILTLMTNYGSGFSRQQLESSAGGVSVSMPKGKALELLPTKHVSSIDDTMHVDGVICFFSCTMANTIEVEVPKLFGVSIGLKECRAECKAAEPKRDQMQTQTHAQTQSSQEPEEHDFFREKVLESTIDALEVESEENIDDIFIKFFSKRLR